MRLPPLALVLSLLACNGDDGPLTKGEYCSRLSGPSCDRAIACGLGPDSNRQNCINVFMDGCCKDDNSCANTFHDKEIEAKVEQFITLCTAAIPAWDCDRWSMGMLPPECRELPTSAVSEPATLPPAELQSTELPWIRDLGHAVGHTRRLLSR